MLKFDLLKENEASINSFPVTVPVISFTVGADYFEEDSKFEEVIVFVDAIWLMTEIEEKYLPNAEFSKTPLQFLQEEYTWDDSIDWYYLAREEKKIAFIRVN